MLIRKPHHCTTLEVWAPKYSTQEVLLHKRKVQHATPIIIVKFTKAKSLIGQRFAIKRETVERCPVASNGTAAMYRVKMGLLEPYETPEDIATTANQLFEQGVLL